MKRLGTQDRVGIALLAFVFLALVGMLALQESLRDRNRRIERADVDPTLPSTRSTLLLLDVTDPLSAVQAEAVRRRLGEMEAFEFQRGELVTLCSIGQYPDGDARSWFRARVPDRSVNALVETASRRAARVDSIFSRPLREALDQALQPSTAERTGLCAAIKEAADLEGFGPTVPSRRLVLVSDLLENAPGFSLYRVPLDSTLQALPGWLRRHAANLQGVEVEVLEVPRPNLDASERSALRAFWKAFFERSGARAVRFRRLP
ncbi:MAG TPA: hypothetical protein VLT84_08155 [Acidobacteriota bacterium]|nr:hypothetical protein [Acidobacteriota bacterium]